MKTTMTEAKSETGERFEAILLAMDAAGLNKLIKDTTGRQDLRDINRQARAVRTWRRGQR